MHIRKKMFQVFFNFKKLWCKTVGCSSAWALSCKFDVSFQNTFFQEHLWTAASVAKSISFWNQYLTWGKGIGNFKDGKVTFNIEGVWGRFLDGGNLPFCELCNLCTYFELWYLSRQWKIIARCSAKFFQPTCCCC